MRILLVAATEFELAPTRDTLLKEGVSSDLHIDFLFAGIGTMAFSYHLMDALQTKTYDMVINAGIAGTYSRAHILGDVVWIESDRFANFGAEYPDGSLRSAFDLDWLKKDDFPFQNGALYSNTAVFDGLKKLHGLTVQKASGSDDTIRNLTNYYSNVSIETMEGAAFFYICRMKGIKAFAQIRSISNYVENRNTENWKTNEAIESLNAYLLDFLKSM